MLLLPVLLAVHMTMNVFGLSALRSRGRRAEKSVISIRRQACLMTTASADPAGRSPDSRRYTVGLACLGGCSAASSRRRTTPCGGGRHTPRIRRGQSADGGNVCVVGGGGSGWAWGDHGGGRRGGRREVVKEGGDGMRVVGRWHRVRGTNNISLRHACMTQVFYVRCTMKALLCMP